MSTMEILVLGYPRTGTQSLAEALKVLGYGECYHMREVGKNKHQGFWVKALQAKFEGKGKTPSREEFDEIFKGFNGTSDAPAAFFPEELLSAYPDAIVILSTRPSQKWYESMLSTLWHQFTHLPPLPPQSQETSQLNSNTNPSMRELSTCYHKNLWGSDFEKLGIQVYDRHNENVRKLSKEQNRKFYEYTVGEGWEGLCSFLGKEVPKDSEGKVLDYPRQDDWAGYKKSVAEEKK